MTKRLEMENMELIQKFKYPETKMNIPTTQTQRSQPFRIKVIFCYNSSITKGKVNNKTQNEINLQIFMKFHSIF